MSYLHAVRLHFSGRFQADPSTINNDPANYDNGTFDPANGEWNPRGTASFRLVDCTVTRVCYADGTSTSAAADDSAIGLRVIGANERVAGKLVDLDPQQQMVSQIWGLIVRLTNGVDDLAAGPFGVAAFSDLWPRAAAPGPDDKMPLSAFYQSVIGPVEWGDTKGSRFLKELRAAAKEGLLSIKFNVDGYQMNQTPDFTFGRIAGTIGPAYDGEPHHFVLGRQLGSARRFMQCVVDRKRNRVLADFGNALFTQVPGGPPQDEGDVALGYLDAGGTFQSLGLLAYKDAGWYESTAGVQQFPPDRDLTKDELKALESSRMAVTSRGSVVMQENLDGLHLRADAFVFRLAPGESANVELYATQYGELLPNAEIVVFLDPRGLQGSQTTPPIVGSPPSAVGGFDPTKPLVTNKKGKATLTITASDPGTPRQFIDGQVYGVRYLLRAIRDAGNRAFINRWDFISLLVWSAYELDHPPAWFDDMRPIFTQYANLYPIMDAIVDLSDYDDVARYAGLLAFAFGLPDSDPNQMPVTRDLSPAKRKAILQWLTTPGPDGKPLKGTPPALEEAVAEAPAAEGDELFHIKSGRVLRQER